MPTASTMTRPGTRRRLASSDAASAPPRRAPVARRRCASCIEIVECAWSRENETETHLLIACPRRVRRLRPALRATRPLGGAAAGHPGRAARHVDRAPGPGVLHARDG